MKRLALALLLVPALAFAQPGDGRPMHDGPPPLERLAELKLTDAQRTKIFEWRSAEMRKTIRLETDARIAEMDLEDAIDSGADTAPIVDRIADLRRQILAARVATRVAVRALLTPEQRAKLRTLRPEGPPPGPTR